MKRIKIEGGKNLTGTVKISGAKNSVVALIPAAILCDEKVEIHNIPNISDIDALDEILRFIGAKIEKNNDTLIIDASDINNIEIPENISNVYLEWGQLNRITEVQRTIHQNQNLICQTICISASMAMKQTRKQM